MDGSHSTSAAGLAGDELAEFYDARYAGDYMAEQPRLEVLRVTQLLAEARQPVRSVLDFGCGRGTWIPVLARCFPGAELTGIDISASAIARAQEDFPGHRFVRFDGHRVPLGDGAVDLVFTYHVLEHVIDLEAAVAEIARVLSPGGQACVIFPCGNRGSLEERVVRMRADGVDAETGRFFYEDSGHLRRLTSAATTERFARAGMTLARAWYANQLWGAIDFLARVGPGVSGELLDAGRARTTRDRARLRALGLALRALTPFVQAYSLSRPVARIREARAPGERLKWCLALMAKGLATPVGAGVERLARLEWERRRARPNGSLQYLLFAKCPE